MLSEKGCLITTHGHQSKPCCTGVLAIEKIRQFTLKWVWKISLKSRKMKEVYGTPTNGTFLSWYLLGVHIRQKWWLRRGPGGTLVVPLVWGPLPHSFFAGSLEACGLHMHNHERLSQSNPSHHTHSPLCCMWHPLGQSLHSPYWKQPNSAYWCYSIAFPNPNLKNSNITEGLTPPIALSLGQSKRQ